MPGSAASDSAPETAPCDPSEGEEEIQIPEDDLELLELSVTTR